MATAVSEAFFSPSWYRVAHLRPLLRGHARFHRHVYRGHVWWVLEDPITGRCHRLTPEAYRMVARMDGAHTTQAIWQEATAELGDDGPTQEETIRILGLLHQADLLRCDVPADTLELLRRSERRESAEGWRRFLNPISLRLPLVDPDAFLARWLPLVRPLFSRAGAALWCGVVAVAALLAARHWTELTRGALDALLEPNNLLLLWVAYPVLKGVHELGHAFAVKVWGGEVHEMGVQLLVFVPVPYVDASAASAYVDKRRRMAVGAAGIAVELFLAALALFVWLSVEPGLVRTLACDVMWIGGASTLLFNGNPLMRFDGYYVLSDAIEIPNLGPRSHDYLSYLVLHHAFGLSDIRNPVTASGEGPWLVFHGVASFVYRLTVLCGIAFFLATKFFVVGLALAVLTLVTQIVLPLLRGASFLLTSPRLGARRRRAIAMSAGALATLAALLLLVPLPLYTRTEGVVLPPEGSEVRPGADGFVARVLAEPDSLVRKGDPLVITRDPMLEAEVAIQQARLRELRAQRDAERAEDFTKVQLTLEEIATAEAALQRARQRSGEVVIRSPAAGRFAAPLGADLLGRFVKQGELLGYVVDESPPRVRVVISQADVALVRERTRAVEVRPCVDVGHEISGRVMLAVPAATDRLPSRALGTRGGGRLAVDPSDTEGLRTLETVFQLDVGLPDDAERPPIGSRVYVRFDHGAEPPGLRAWRGLRRLLLRRIGV